MTQGDLFGVPGSSRGLSSPWPDFIPEGEIDFKSGKAGGVTCYDWREFSDWIHTPSGGEVANLFMRESIAMRRRGFTQYGAQAVIEHLRWLHHMEHGPDATVFKVSHNWRKRLALWAMYRNPAELKDFFRTQDPENDAEGGDDGRQ